MFILVETLNAGQRCVGLDDALTRIRSVADYQFGKGVGDKLFPKITQISYSKRTGRIRYVHLDGKRLVTLRPTDGLFSLSIAGAKRIREHAKHVKCLVTVQQDVAKFIEEGGDVFAAHIAKTEDSIRSKDEVIIVDEEGEVLAVGRAVLSGEEMRAFKRGVAVKVRRGRLQEG